jgi:hypothetical protein
MIERALQRTLELAMNDHPNEIGVAVDTVDGGVGVEVDDRNILDNDLPGLGIIAAMNEKALVFIPEVIAEYAIYPIAFLFNDQLGQVVVMHAGHFHVGTAKP